MGFLNKIAEYLTSDGSVKLPPSTGRNEPCHCGSGQKYKKCCFDKDERIRYEISCKCAGTS